MNVSSLLSNFQSLNLIDQDTFTFFVPKENLLEVCLFLHKENDFFFDYLSCITCIDLGVENAQLELVYHLFSLPFNRKIVLKTRVSRNFDETIPSISGIWKTANWHEREVFDLFGLSFSNHPDLRRILLPANWEGHPLRKDYQVQEYYQGIKVES